jgi:hypothetical protein
MSSRTAYMVGIAIFATGLALLIAGIVVAYRYIIGLPIPDYLVGVAQETASEGENGPFLIGLPGALIAVLGFVIARRNEA